MRAVAKLVAVMAAAGICGPAQAGNVNAVSMDAVTKKSGNAGVVTGPDVTKVPGSPAGPVPIPYPNLGMKDKGASGKKKAKDAPGQKKNASAYRKTTGDEAGTLKGVVSKKKMDQATFKKGSSNVKTEGVLINPLGSMTRHNGSSANTPPGAQIAPSQTKVILSNTAVPGAAKPRTTENTGPGQIPPAAIPAPAVLRPAAPLTPIAKPVLRPVPLPVAPAPVKVPQPILVQPVQPKPMTALPPRTVLTR